MDKEKRPEHYIASHAPDLGIGFFQAKGPRAEQQDGYCLFKTEKSLNAEDMKELFGVMNAATSGSAPILKGGSTVNLLAVSPGRLISGNLGDSMTTLFTRKAAGDDIEAKGLSMLHTAAMRDELLRIAALGDISSEKAIRYVERGRIFASEGDKIYSLAMSRALGDVQFEPMLSRDPDIYEVDFNLDGLSYAQVALYTDGITDVRAYPHDDLKHDTLYFGALTQDALAQEEYAALALGGWAMDSGLVDNATALSLDLRAYDGKSSFLLGIFDGHNKQAVDVIKAAVSALQSHNLLA